MHARADAKFGGIGSAGGKKMRRIGRLGIEIEYFDKETDEE
jgi:hypothetical protein